VAARQCMAAVGRAPACSVLGKHHYECMAALLLMHAT
jgi:hypothetical protein